MATLMDDCSLLIYAALDGPFEEIVRGLGAKQVKSVVTDLTDTTSDITGGRPGRAANRQQMIKDLIKQMQALEPKLTFVQCWNILQRDRPELFAQAS
jgi:hypothetical protein